MIVRRRWKPRAGLWEAACVVMLLLPSGRSSGAEPPPVVAGSEVQPDDLLPAAVRLTWPALLELADQHPRLAASQHSVAAARAAVDAAGAAPNPSLEAAVGRGRERNEDARGREWDLELSIPLGWIVDRPRRVAAASADLEAARWQVNGVRREIIGKMHTLFWSLAHEQSRVAALELLHQQTAELARVVRRRVQMGESRPVETVRVEVVLETVEAELDSARATLRSRQDQLRLWIPASRVGEEIEVEVAADLAALPPVVDRESAVERAIAAHPGLMAAKAKADALAATADVERRSRIPGITLKAFTVSELDRQAHGGGVSFDVPIWNWNSGRIAEADAKLLAWQKEIEATVRELESTTIEAQTACATASGMAERFRDRVLPRIESAAATIERTYQVGETSLLEVIDARRELVRTRLQYLEYLAKAQIECGGLAILIGEEDL